MHVRITSEIYWFLTPHQLKGFAGLSGVPTNPALVLPEGSSSKISSTMPCQIDGMKVSIGALTCSFAGRLKRRSAWISDFDATWRNATSLFLKPEK